MKTSIYVFSGTGTSIAVAKRLGDSLGDTEIKLIPHIMKNSDDNDVKTTSGRIGFVFPNYYGRVPNMVVEFIRRLDLRDANYIFGIVTAGGNQGYSLKFLAQEIEKRGKKLNYGKCIAGLSNYIVAWYYKLLSKKGEQRKESFVKLDKMTRSIAIDIANQKNDIQKDSYLGYRISQLVSPKNDREDIQSLDNDYSVGSNCVGCETCMRVCQFNNIKMKNGKPEFLHTCNRCMACLQYCPQNAIKFRNRVLDELKYNHPDYPAKVMIDYINSEK